MKRTALLVDGGFLLPMLKRRMGRDPSAADVYEFGLKTLEANEELFRFYYYDCPPFEGMLRHPISAEEIDYAQSKMARARKQMLAELVKKDYIAFRRGMLSFDGWQITKDGVDRLMREAASSPPNPVILTAEEVHPKFTQKRVDMNIGLDVAWLSSKRLVDRIILVTADSDFIPAMKFARREGVQVILVPLESRPKAELIEHSDIVRNVVFP
ncbi:NYN domain-containing protein [Meiothermus taiwanensis]|uniref:NYN domain protein n=2 Tax=Meiothermus taiwanensis TaxID=172827 RepID=A0A399E6V2_9DEIN|nr:NYN domain-containing protein [Meiothermus taiwanensis]AWR87476.1 hypothetical protein Mtai_v1c22450 [Meiothermus taiwanensis WR-220]KZK16198.1 hypothetical protein A3962_07260 [Meiothermus taiwanensis]RIH78480.1 NYN domain protein [Meiothermus taiwanensis]